MNRWCAARRQTIEREREVQDKKKAGMYWATIACFSEARQEGFMDKYATIKMSEREEEKKASMGSR